MKKKYVIIYGAQVLGVLLVAIPYTINLSSVQPDKAAYVVRFMIFTALAWIITSLFMVHIYNFALTKTRNVVLFIAVIVVVVVILPVVALLVSNGFKLIFWRPGFEPFSRRLFEAHVRSNFVDYLHSTFIYLFTYYLLEFRNQREETLRATLLANEAQLKMLQYQINPHFLFNSLNAIQSMIEKDKNRAKEMTADLSDFFRYSLSRNDQMMVPLCEELDAVSKYLAIQKDRFAARLSISYEVADDTLQIRIPAFIIHPLVENSIKYGFLENDDAMQLLIRTEKQDGALAILVKNSGSLQISREKGVKKIIGTKTGIDNIKKRLSLSYPGRSDFELSEKGEWVTAKITIRDI